MAAEPSETHRHSTEQAQVVTLGLAQIAPALGDLARNRQIHREVIAEARQRGVDVLIFPELSLTGYELRDQVADVAVRPDGPEIAELLEEAGTMGLVVGFVEQSPHHEFFNAAFYSEAGQVRHVHRKVYLPTYGLFDEGRYFAHGGRLRAFQTNTLGRVGLLICEDFWHLSAAVVMQAEAVDVLICVANSPGRGVGGPQIATSVTYDLLSRTYAQSLGAAVVLVNRVGYDDGLCFWGGSRLVSPAGHVLSEAPQFEPTLHIAQLDLGALRRERLLTPLVRDEQLLLTIEELTRIRRRRFEG